MIFPGPLQQAKEGTDVQLLERVHLRKSKSGFHYLLLFLLFVVVSLPEVVFGKVSL